MKILVPTDFSTNSIAGIHFAIYLGSLTAATLEFIYVNHLDGLLSTEDASPSVENEESSHLYQQLEHFILEAYKQVNLAPENYHFRIIRGVKADSAILNYCEKHPAFDYICLSSKGAGSIDRLFGTNTGNLVMKSDVPVIVVPLSYTIEPISKIVYASDLLDYDTEIKKVIRFASPLKAPIEVLHFIPDLALIPDRYHQQDQEEKYDYGLSFHFEKSNPMHTLLKNLKEQITAMKPSVLVLFTKRYKSFFQKLFLSSVAEGLSFHAPVPMLITNKDKTTKT